jgi:TRAP-type mannitol/chloroaromatic compound transport system permease small subunit|tara:strand:+ start:2531 stop:3046 length:516 start_codon:yes stop_codon:yes gene_type:complete
MNLINLISKAIDHAIKVIGNAVSWLTLIMTVITFLIVILRYVFNIGSIWMQESLVWMHSAIFLLGAAYTLKLDEHVRVDIFYRSFSPKQKSWVNIIGAIFFALPVCIFLLIVTGDFVSSSWLVKEISRDAGGLLYPAIPLLKSMLLIMPLLIIFQIISILCKEFTKIREAS